MKTQVSVWEHDRGWNELVSKLRSLKVSANAHVRVGIFSKGEGGKPHQNSKKQSLTVAEIGLVHEFGAPSRKIPERSFLRSTLEKNASKYVAELARGLRSFLANREDVKRVFETVGQLVSWDVKNAIRAGVGPSLAQSTLEARNKKVKKDKKGRAVNARGRLVKSFADHKPLFDTGQLARAITYAVKLGRSR